MSVEENNTASGNLYYRLVTLWVISEGVAGGLIHGLHFPLSGMFLSGFAVLCICLIGYYAEDKNVKPEFTIWSKFSKHGAILKATVIVCVFKMMLSPNTPPTAYFAVLFQGVVGQILFFDLKHFKRSCVILGFLALIESAIQRILVLVLLYGINFWHAVNEFISKLTQQKVVNNYALLLAISYLIIHGIVGILIGIWSARLVPNSKLWERSHQEFIITQANTHEPFQTEVRSHKKRKIVKSIFLFIWLILVILFLQSFFSIGKPLIPSYKALQILLRSLLIFFTWYFLVSPFLTKIIKRKLIHQKEKSNREISRILLLLPSIENIFRKSWDFSGSVTGLKRLRLFWKIVLMNVLRDQ